MSATQRLHSGQLDKAAPPLPGTSGIPAPLTSSQRVDLIVRPTDPRLVGSANEGAERIEM